MTEKGVNSQGETYDHSVPLPVNTFLMHCHPVELRIKKSEFEGAIMEAEHLRRKWIENQKPVWQFPKSSRLKAGLCK
jgi:hypothetical protein